VYVPEHCFAATPYPLFCWRWFIFCTLPSLHSRFPLIPPLIRDRGSFLALVIPLHPCCDRIGATFGVTNACCQLSVSSSIIRRNSPCLESLTHDCGYNAPTFDGIYFPSAFPNRAVPPYRFFSRCLRPGSLCVPQFYPLGGNKAARSFRKYDRVITYFYDRKLTPISPQ